MPRLVATLAVLVLGIGRAWAEVIPGVDHAVNGVADTFLDKGVIGAVAVIFILATGALAYAYNSLWKARLEDQKAAAGELKAANKEGNDALNASSKTVAALAVAVDTHSRDAERRHGDLRTEIDALVKGQNDINIALARGHR